MFRQVNELPPQMLCIALSISIIIPDIMYKGKLQLEHYVEIKIVEG